VDRSPTPPFEAGGLAAGFDMKTVFLRSPDAEVEDRKDLRLPEEGGYLWIWTTGPVEKDVIEQLRLPTRLHRFVTERPLHPGHAFSKEAVATSLFSIGEDLPPMVSTPFSVVVGARWVLLVLWGDIPLFDGAWRERHVLVRQGPDMILGSLLDPLLDRYSHVVDSLVHRADVVDDLVLEGAPRLYRDIHQVRKEALILRHLLQPELDALAVLEDHPRTEGDSPGHPYIQDLLYRLQRIAEEVDGVRDGMMAVVESYASVVANRMNRVMKTLTVVSVVFLPATLIASVYGMNFRIPEFHWRFGYAYSITLMAVVSIGSLVYMRVKGWFT